MIVQQRVAVLLAGLLLLVLFFGFDIKSSQQIEGIQQRSKTGLSLDINTILKKAGESLGPERASELAALEVGFQQAEEPERSQLLKKISGFWFRQKQPYLAGSFAKQAAEQENSAEAWSIAGTTFIGGITSGPEDERQACFQEATYCLEQAISLEPDNVNHRVNQALAYVRKPPADNPMRGIQMLLRLNENEPENVVVLLNLAKLAIETGQWDRAKVRLEKAAEVEPENSRVVCLLAEVLQRLQDPQWQATREKCDLLTE